MKKSLLFILFSILLVRSCHVFTMEDSSRNYKPNIDSIRPITALQSLAAGTTATGIQTDATEDSDGDRSPTYEDFRIEAQVDSDSDEPMRRPRKVARINHDDSDTIIRIDRLEHEIQELEDGRALSADEEESQRRNLLCNIASSNGLGRSLSKGHLEDLCSRLYEQDPTLRSIVGSCHKGVTPKKGPGLASILGQVSNLVNQDTGKQDAPEVGWILNRVQDFIAQDYKDQRDRADRESNRANTEKERADQAHKKTTATAVIGAVREVVGMVTLVALIIVWIYREFK